MTRIILRAPPQKEQVDELVGSEGAPVNSEGVTEDALGADLLMSPDSDDCGSNFFEDYVMPGEGPLSYF